MAGQSKQREHRVNTVTWHNNSPHIEKYPPLQEVSQKYITTHKLAKHGVLSLIFVKIRDLKTA